jgi:hypothetical protein
MLYYAIVAIILLLVPTGGFGQSVVPQCDAGLLLRECTQPADQLTGFSSSNNFADDSNDDTVPTDSAPQAAISATSDASSGAKVSEGKRESFNWGKALKESVTFIAIEQAWVVHTDFPWVVSERGVPFNHYWRDYKQSLERWWEVGWSAGENPMYNYVGHPIQGAITEYIFFQNDPKSRYLELSKSKAYWYSRIKGTIFNGVYSTQWSIGPLSEMTVEKYGSNDRPPWTASGAFPCNPKIETCYWGVGKVNLVMTPVGGLGWVLAEDWMDKNIVRRVESRTRNRFLIDAARCTFNPIRAAGNILYGARPWFRFRDVRDSTSAPQQ